MENQPNISQPVQEPQPTQKKTLTPILMTGVVILLLITLFLGYSSYSKSRENEKLEQEYSELSIDLLLANNRITQLDNLRKTSDVVSDSNYFSSLEKTYVEYVNTDIGYKFTHPDQLSYDETTHSLLGEILGNNKIFIEVSTKKLSDCTLNCDTLRALGSIKIDNNPVNIYLGTKIDEENNYYNKYLTYEIGVDNKNFYISYQFDTENLSIEQIDIFTQIATSFEYRPDLVKDDSVSAEIMELPVAGKPVIYLYPESIQDVNVKLKYNGDLIATYPNYPDQGWNVKAYPDGNLINYPDSKEYSYLFWEGENHWKFSEVIEGFVVSGSDTALFLQTKLAELGLTPKEYNEFIVYWLPLMQNNKYNLIHFAQEEYTDNAILNITPKPDSVLRVFMTYKEIDEPIDIQPQIFKDFNRNGFTVVEWGGTKL